jgi:hypothetical protein
MREGFSRRMEKDSALRPAKAKYNRNNHRGTETQKKAGIKFP